MAEPIIPLIGKVSGFAGISSILIADESIRLHKRIIEYYGSFNKQEWDACFDFLDPKLKEDRVYDEVYVDSLSTFFERYGPIQIESIEKLDLHFHHKNSVYENRPFAFGLVRWKDNQGQRHTFRECWVKFRTTWYSRKTGLV